MQKWKQFTRRDNMSLTIEELSELEDKIIEELPYKITAVLSKLNRSDRLEEFLEMIDMTELLEKKQDFYSYKEGKIVVIGGTKVKEEVLLGIASKLGIDKNRFEFYLDYKLKIFLLLLIYFHYLLFHIHYVAQVQIK